MPNANVSTGAVPSPRALWPPLSPAERHDLRQATRDRIHRRVAHPIDAPRTIPDSLVHCESRILSAVTISWLLVTAVALHVAAVALLGVFALTGGRAEPAVEERVRVSVVDIRPPAVPDQVPPLTPLAGALEPEFAPDPAPDPAPAAPPPPPRPRRVQPPTPAPTEPVPTESAPTADSPPRRIVGLNFESTIGAGAGPAFAVGTSRLGVTNTRATDPTVASMARATEGPVVAPGGGGQRESFRIPSRGGVFARPRRLAPARPSYPPRLRAQGVEGDVLVRVELDPEGRVINAAIVRGSGERLFDETALRAARRERFSPATRDGSGVRHSLTYSYRFRIDD